MTLGVWQEGRRLDGMVGNDMYLLCIHTSSLAFPLSLSRLTILSLSLRSVLCQQSPPDWSNLPNETQARVLDVSGTVLSVKLLWRWDTMQPPLSAQNNTAAKQNAQNGNWRIWGGRVTALINWIPRGSRRGIQPD